jgi:hypothetical protein
VGQTYRLTLETEQEGLRGDRTLVATDCQDLLRAATLVLALAFGEGVALRTDEPRRASEPARDVESSAPLPPSTVDATVAPSAALDASEADHDALRAAVFIEVGAIAGLLPEASFLGALGGRYPAEVAVELAPEERDAPPVEGPLVGGCLSLLASLEGTPYVADTAGALLFVEDVDEPLYRLDRLLTHLRLSGRLARIRALLFGHLDGRDGAPALEALRRGLDPVDWPIAWNLPVGHRAPNLTLPVGLLSRLEPAAGSLVLGGGERR